MGVVDVPKAKDIWPIWNPHMGRIQVVTGWKVYVAPLFQDGMEFLEFTQGDNKGLLATYI
jgi:hypothetical protein